MQARKIRTWVGVLGLALFVALCIISPRPWGRLNAAPVTPVDDCWKAAAKCYVAPSGGEPIDGNFRLNYWNVPPTLPADKDFPIRVSFTRLRGNENAVLSPSVIGEWAPAQGWAIPGPRMLKVNQTAEENLTIHTPRDPGTYRIRLFIRSDFKPTPTFQGDSDHVWSELVVRVVNE